MREEPQFRGASRTSLLLGDVERRCGGHVPPSLWISTHAPVRGATSAWDAYSAQTLISTHAHRAGSDAHPRHHRPHGGISTHAPRAGSDYGERKGLYLGVISTHAPRAGSDRGTSKYATGPTAFQPTLPVRGATPPGRETLGDSSYFNPRSPCGERRLSSSMPSSQRIFQPTLPVRGATLSDRLRRPMYPISTHAPRAGSDPCVRNLTHAVYISTHAPRAGSDGGGPTVWVDTHISTHAPRAGSDSVRREFNYWR